MGVQFGALRYRGDVSDRCQPGSILGADEFGRPYEVIDVAVDLEPAPGHYDGDGCTFPQAGHLERRSTVHVQYATTDNIRAAVAKLRQALT